MNPRASLRRIAPALALGAVFASVSLHASGAHAGTLQVRDTAAILSPADTAQLTSDAAPHPFNVRVLTTNAAFNRSTLDQLVHAQVTAPNLVVVGVDPVHRLTSVHFGLGTGIHASQFAAIDDAGDAFFRQGNWRGGIAAMLARAGAAVGTAPAYPQPAPAYGYARQPAYGYPARAPVVVQQPAGREGSSGFLWLGLFVLGGVVVAAIVLARRGAARTGTAFGGAPYREGAAPGPMYPPSGGYGHGYYAPPPSTPSQGI